MKNSLLFALLLLAGSAQAQRRFSNHELSLNAFRNPSIGLEYRYRYVSVHGGYYPTNFESGITTTFLRSGVTLWFLPVGHRSTPSSFYASASYLRGLTRDYADQNAALAEAGFRWMVWRGLNLRLGVAALYSPRHDWKINPTPGISYSFFFN